MRQRRPQRPGEKQRRKRREHATRTGLRRVQQVLKRTSLDGLKTFQAELAIAEELRCRD